MSRSSLIQFAFIALAIGFLFSCKPDKKEEEVAPADPKSRFIASWQCTEVSKRDPQGQPYTVHVVDSTGSYVLIENFYGLGFNRKAKARITGDSINVIVPQTISGVYVLRASGILQNATTIKMNYVIDDGNPVKDTCSATLIKQ